MIGTQPAIVDDLHGEHPSAATDQREARFGRLFKDAERDILAYALRRVARPEDAADIVAETFLVAWRRLDDVPAGDGARLWLYGVARRQLANQRRGDLRRSRLGDRLRDVLATTAAATAVADTDGGEHVAAIRGALERLSERDRELLTLSNWEGLDPAQIAVVLEAPAVTVRSRLHRARRRLRTEFEREIGGAGAYLPTAAPERTDT
jgi:RNA polymerase sigma factor (sigma-70 family)